MDSWLVSLLIFMLGIIIATLFFIPQWGLFSFLKRGWRMTDRVLIEDALKHIQLCDFENRKATLFSVSGALSIPCELTYQVLEKMFRMDLIRMSGQTIQLTTKGYEYAMRIIRAHRLSEQYLAQETGYPYEELHQRAHKIEHDLSDEQANILSTKLGNPIFDLHGDPIPSANGKIKHLKEVPLTSVLINQSVKITHLEDEPKEIYAQLLAESLYPGLAIHLVEKTKYKIRFWSKEGEHALAPIVAANISVIPLPDATIFKEKTQTSLTKLPIGKETKIIEISQYLRKNERMRLMDLGFVPGTLVEANLRSIHGDLTAYRVRGSLIALRQEQTDWIKIEPLPSNTEDVING